MGMDFSGAGDFDAYGTNMDNFIWFDHGNRKIMATVDDWIGCVYNEHGCKESETDKLNNMDNNNCCYTCIWILGRKNTFGVGFLGISDKLS